eukprot:TRINITY_DN78360_c0_g1_i1.p1 TRINITY_DN78360_c0_g1~~TRINITY_DN78360_c0_g1_i1.p1  ORF type:complete len:198 (+),score=43.66 TRINITY_DN78360_c0_g1_i1:27-596(+)
MSDRLVQFKVSDVSPQTEEAELLHALKVQLSLEGVQMQRNSLRFTDTGNTKEAVFSVSREEGWYLTGPMKRAKVDLGGQLVVLNFEKIKKKTSTSTESQAFKEAIKPQPEENGKRQSVESASQSEDDNSPLNSEVSEPSESNSSTSSSQASESNSSPPRSLLDRDLSSKETLELLKELSLRRRMKSTTR